MSQPDVVVYVSDNSLKSNKVIDLMNDYNISYKKKNISNNSNYMKELHQRDIYGTPAVFIDDKQAILGYQKNKIKYALGIGDQVSHYSSLFDGFKK